MSEKQNLLMIDGDADLVASVTMVMEDAGWEVHSADNGLSGIEQARQDVPDLVILDMLMPRQDGLTTYEQLRSDPALGEIPIIVLTSVSERLGIGFSDEDFKAHYGHGPEAFLRKPFEPTIRLETVNRLHRPRV